MMNKLIIITGATKGIGRAILQKFAAQGFDAVICARNAKDLEECQATVEAAYGTKVFYKVTDMADTAQVKAFGAYVLSLGRPVEVLVNNAGFFAPGQIQNEEEGVLESTLNTNLVSAYHLTRALLGAMMEQKSGHIFNMCSTASIMAYVNGGSYCISKFALYAMSKVLREETKQHGIRVTSILPGATYTASWEGVDLPIERFMKAEDVAEATWGAYSLSAASVVEEILIRPQLGDI
jgi:short-subunit dehydrogenase